MTSYWKPRWPNRVVFGSFHELRYRIDVGEGGSSRFRVTTSSGPGFEISLARSPSLPGFSIEGGAPEAARKLWLSSGPRQKAIAGLLSIHFSLFMVKPVSMQWLCDPRRDDLFPESGQFNWCLEQVYILWSAVPAGVRLHMPMSDFLD